ncbi:MAG: aryl-sulfate sulfotransferase [Deltaproteobacteria bacterium]|nr:aryl-sulfate sulfotransferase [Deltaproteobacteria bacterium]
MWPIAHLSGTIYYDPKKASNGYTVWCPLGAGESGEPNVRPSVINLMDMRGNVVHSWKTAYPVHYGYLLPDGNMLALLRWTSSDGPDAGGYKMGGGAGLLAEYDWDGNVVFEYYDPFSHHDVSKLDNGNYIYVGWEKVPPDLAKKVRGGQPGTEHKDGTMFCDYFREIDPQGNTVWEWRGYEHLDPDIDVIGHIHARNEWTHINDIDVMPDGNILTDARHTDGAFIVEKKTGDIIWRWGNVAYLDKETGQVELGDVRNPKTMGGPHAAHIIQEGLPGAGNMLIYDNGMYVYGSRALEVDIKTGDIVWQSEDHRPVCYVHGRTHFSPYISNAQRLPNGNTLICEGQNGLLFEVTPDQELVWQWIRPTPAGPDNATQKWGIYRAYRFAPDYCPQLASLPPAEGEVIIPELPHGMTW